MLSSIRAQLTKAYQTAAVLFEVLKAVNVSQKIEVDQSVTTIAFLAISVLVARSSFSFIPFSHNTTVNRPLQILETHNQVEEKKKLYLPYNILPLDPDSANQAIMRYPEVATYFVSTCYHSLRGCLCPLSPLCVQIQAAFHALRNTRGLPWPKEHEKKPDADLLGWLQAMFGFQVITLGWLFTIFFLFRIR